MTKYTILDDIGKLPPEEREKLIMRSPLFNWLPTKDPIPQNFSWFEMAKLDWGWGIEKLYRTDLKRPRTGRSAITLGAFQEEIPARKYLLTEASQWQRT